MRVNIKTLVETFSVKHDAHASQSPFFFCHIHLRWAHTFGCFIHFQASSGPPPQSTSRPPRRRGTWKAGIGNRFERSRKSQIKKRFGGGGGGEPAAKRQAAGDEGPSESAEDGTVVAEISKNKKVSVRSWKGKVYVDMREFYVKDGKTLPTRKGISLQLDQWKILRDNIKAIDEAIKENA
ncbi:RNA polymerase II transcriptional coactivator SUB1-like [Panicum virgatum]|nr:RNA polymerase II transcriptional coactivator SUB1-like [Panicum virgatum]